MSEEIIRAAVKKAFPEGAGELTPLTGGMSGALVFGFEAEGKPWVVRHSHFAGTERLRVGASSGAGPVLRYVDVASEVAIMERFEGVPSPGAQDPESRKAIATAIRRIHRGPAFSESITTADFYRSIGARYVERAGQALPPALTDLLARCIERSRDAPTAPCHRDLNPGNVLVGRDESGAPRVCILDWDSAAAGDPFLDLAQFSLFYAPQPEMRVAVLRDYLEREPTDAELARAAEARIFAFTSYALAFAYMHSLSGKALRAEPMPLAEMFAHLGQHGPKSDADAVSASMLAEAQRLSVA